MVDISDAQKLEVLDGLIQEFRENGTAILAESEVAALRAIHADYHAKKPGMANKALQSLSHQIGAAVRMKARIGFIEMGNLQAIAECAMAHWPTIRRALEQTETSK